MGDLTGKVAIVTGAAGRLGSAAARALTQAGAQVLAVDLTNEHVEELCKEIANAGGSAEPWGADVSDERAVISMIEAAVEAFGGLDIMFNNAGLVGLEHNMGLLELDVDLWDRILAVNLRGVMLGCKHAIPALLERGGGSIINTSSDSSLGGDIENHAYAAAKAGVNTLTKYVAAGFGKSNIRCNAIAPGIHLDTAFLASLDDARRAFYANFADHILLPRLGTPEDIAKAVVFLGSDDAEYITGQIIQVDGGLMGHVPHLADVRRTQRAATK